MNERDMRVIKTKESIEKAFFDLLGTKPLDKVTVAPLPMSRSSPAGTSTAIRPSRLSSISDPYSFITSMAFLPTWA